MSDPQRKFIEHLFQAHYRSLCQFVRRIVMSHEAAEDIVQDLFLRLWEQQEHRQPPSLSKAYLYRAAHNHALDHLRHRRVERRWAAQKKMGPIPVAPEVDAEYRSQELGRAIDAAIAHLPRRCREIFLLHRQQELSYTEIAQVLSLSIKTVETQMGRALKSLRMNLAEFLVLGGMLLGG